MGLSPVELDPNMEWGVNRRLSGHAAKYETPVSELWSLLLEAYGDGTGDDIDLGWYDFLAAIKQRGWDSINIRSFERMIKPRLHVSSILSNRSPIAPTDAAVDRGFIGFQIRVVSRHNADVSIPDDAVASVFRCVRKSLEDAIMLMHDTVEGRYFHLPAIEPDNREGERHVSPEGLEGHFLWAVSLFKRLASLEPSEARRELSVWPNPDRSFFDKMRIFAWSLNELCSPHDVATGMLSLTDESFFDHHLQRELLHVLRDRWRHFSSPERARIERRVRTRPLRYAGESLRRHRHRATFTVMSRLGWLEKQGCELSDVSLRMLTRHRTRLGWTEAQEAKADRDLDGRVGWVTRDTSPDQLSSTPLRDVIQTASRESRTGI